MRGVSPVPREGVGNLPPAAARRLYPTLRYYCDVNLDEDEYYRFISTEYKECPYYRNGDEYRVVRHQM